MWRGLIAAVLIAWSPAAFARSDFGIKVQQAMEMVKAVGKTPLSFIECKPTKSGGGQTCLYYGEMTDNTASIWTFQASESGYLEGIGLHHQRRRQGIMPRFDDPTLERARELVVTMITVASITPSQQIDDKRLKLLAAYITSALLGDEPLPRLPVNIQVDYTVQRSHFSALIRRPYD